MSFTPMESKISFERRWVLLVEGDETNARIVQNAFERRGASFELTVVSTLAKATDAMEGRAFDLVIADWRLPDGEGIDLLKGKPRFPLLLMTENGNDQMAADGMSSGALDYVAKSEDSLIDMPKTAERAIRLWTNLAAIEEKLRVAEETLRKPKREEDWFRLMVEAAPNAMIMVGTDGLITLVNAQTEKLFGYGRHELLGRQLEMLVPQRFRANHGGLRRAFFHAPASRAMGIGRDLFGVRKDGSEVPVEIGLNPIVTAEGQFVLASIIDITERKKAAERFQLVVEAAPNAMIMVGGDGLITLVNAQTEKLFRYSRHELLGRSMEMLVPERFRANHGGLRRAFFASPATRAMGVGRDLFGLRKDGSEVPVEIGLNPIVTAEGQFVLASIIDITERKKAEEHFQLSKAIVDGVHDYGIFMLDPQGYVLTWNEGAARMKGYSASQIVGQHFSRFYPPDAISAGHPEEELRIARAEGKFEEEGWRLRRDGSRFWANVLITALFDRSGNVRGFSKLTRDITDRKRYETELQARAAELERFTYTVSHDLKSPLITIKSFVAMIDQDLAAGSVERARSDLERIGRAADKMNRLLEELLALSRVGRVVHAPEKVAFGSLVEEALELVAGRIHERHIDVQVAADLPVVTVDRIRIVEVLQNLIDNAAKFTGDQNEPRILIGASSDGAETRCFVKDNGAGVEARHHQRIFGLFDKLDPKSAGSGAGLALAKRIVEIHGGRIWIESPGSGGGSTFWFTLKDPDGSSQGGL
jgi:PAS domain S-box-containing protein